MSNIAAIITVWDAAPQIIKGLLEMDRIEKILYILKLAKGLNAQNSNRLKESVAKKEGEYKKKWK